MRKKDSLPSQKQEERKQFGVRIVGVIFFCTSVVLQCCVDGWSFSEDAPPRCPGDIIFVLFFTLRVVESIV